nr:MAG TPA: hypothetical protein [Caudoviricetes sp.]
MVKLARRPRPNGAEFCQDVILHNFFKQILCNLTIDNHPEMVYNTVRK